MDPREESAAKANLLRGAQAGYSSLPWRRSFRRGRCLSGLGPATLLLASILPSFSVIAVCELPSVTYGVVVINCSIFPTAKGHICLPTASCVANWRRSYIKYVANCLSSSVDVSSAAPQPGQLHVLPFFECFLPCLESRIQSLIPPSPNASAWLGGFTNGMSRRAHQHWACHRV